VVDSPLGSPEGAQIRSVGCYLVAGVEVSGVVFVSTAIVILFLLFYDIIFVVTEF
jgi:hypothetical protein